MEETGQPEESIDRTTLWKKARELKTGGYTPAVKEVVDKIVSLSIFHDDIFPFKHSSISDFVPISVFVNRFCPHFSFCLLNETIFNVNRFCPHFSYMSPFHTIYNSSQCSLNVIDLVIFLQDELQKNESLGEVVSLGTNDLLTQALGTKENRGRVRGMGKFVTTHQYFYLPTAMKQLLNKEEKLAKRMNKLEYEMK
jgi:hypothetical protein